MLRKILLTLTAVLTTAAGLFGITKLSADQVENKEIIKEIYYEDDFNILFKSMNDELYQIKNYDLNNSSPDLIKYDVSKNYEVLFSKNNFLLIKENSKILLFYDGKLIKDVTDDVKDKNILFVDKTSIYYQNENKLIQFNFNTKQEKQLADNFEKLLYFRYNNDKIIELTYLSKELNGQLNFKKFNNENSSTLDNKSLAEITNKYKVIEDKLFILKNNQVYCYDTQDGNLIFEDNRNTDFNENFYYSNNYYRNDKEVYFYDTNLSISDKPIQILKYANFSLLSFFAEDNTTLAIRNKSESDYTFINRLDGNIKIISLTDKELVYKTENKYYKLSLLTNSGTFQSFGETAEIPELNNFKVIKYTTYNDSTFSILTKDDKLYLRKKVSEELQEKTFDITSLYKKNTVDNVKDTFENIKKDIKTQGNKILEFFKVNWFYFAVGFIGLFSFIFISVKLSNRKRRR